MDSHTFWRHQGSIFGLDNYHCYIFGGFTYYLKTHSTYPSVNYHCYSIYSHTSWQWGWHICISELPLIFDGFTYFLKTQEWHMCIRELPLSFSGFTYHLKTQGSIFVLVDHHWFDGFKYLLKMLQRHHIFISELLLLHIWWIYIPIEVSVGPNLY